MNYFAHGYRFVERPYFLAGTAVPDWLSVVDRSIRVRGKHAEEFSDDDDDVVRDVAQGVLQHQHDDRWFHATRAFTELSLQITAIARDALSRDPGFRPSFLGHILVELMLDAELTRRDPSLLDQYYDAVDQTDFDRVAAAVSRITEKDASMLAHFIGRFAEVRFLQDYLEDATLMIRLNQVMQRVRLRALPDSFQNILPQARQLVCDRADELLAEPT